MADRGHLHEYLLGKIVQKITKYLLIFLEPDRMKGVWCGRLLPVLVLGDDGLGWFRRGAVNIAIDARAYELRHDLRAPEDEVCAGELLGNLAGEGGVG